MEPRSAGLVCAPTAARIRAKRPPPSSRAMSTVSTTISAPASGGQSRKPYTEGPKNDRLKRASSPGGVSRIVEVIEGVAVEVVMTVGSQVEGQLARAKPRSQRTHSAHRAQILPASRLVVLFKVRGVAVNPDATIRQATSQP